MLSTYDRVRFSDGFGERAIGLLAGLTSIRSAS
jgi:hypothetical protein